jgi:hypothetical protein
MSPEFKYHVERLRAGTTHRLTMANIPEWISRNTFIKGQPYSFFQHEYQEKILRDQSQETITRKCSQIGLSETTARKALALCGLTRGYTVAYTLPTAGFAGTFMRTRIDPVIQGSPYLSALIHPTTDNAEVKRLGDSFLYLKGCQSDNAPISVPCDHIITDELDFSDPTVVSQYQSRLTHSEFKRWDKLSTPTLPKRGIDYEFQRSRRHFNLVKCNHCNHWFMPDYYTHVVIPDFSGDLKDINKNNLHDFRYTEAYVSCPSCGGRPLLTPDHREWVCENPTEAFLAAGYQITPFDCGRITPGDLVLSSTRYKKITDFVNFGLGYPAEDAESVLSREELENCLVESRSEGTISHVLGLDIGMVSWCLVGAVHYDQSITIIHAEPIPVQNLRTRVKELEKHYRVRISVADALPFVETILAMQQTQRNLYAAIFMRSKAMETFNLKRKDEEHKQGIKDLRQVNVNRDKAMDALMDAIRTGLIRKVHDEHDEAWVEHCTAMSRIKEWTPDAEMSYVWRKPESGDDHLWFATLFMHLASQILGVSRNTGPQVSLVPQTFKEKPATNAR